MSVLLPEKKQDSTPDRISGKESGAECDNTGFVTMSSPPHGIAAWRFVLAFAVAVLADTLFVLLTPFEPVEIVLDMLVAVILCAVLGFSWIFVPALLAEAVPGVDVAPCWTMAVLALAGINVMKT